MENREPEDLKLVIPLKMKLLFSLRGTGPFRSQALEKKKNTCPTLRSPACHILHVDLYRGDRSSGKA